MEPKFDVLAIKVFIAMDLPNNIRNPSKLKHRVFSLQEANIFQVTLGYCLPNVFYMKRLLPDLHNLFHWVT